MSGRDTARAARPTIYARAVATTDELWIERLPALLTACAERWDLTVGERLSGGLVGHAFACTTSNGRQVVLKLNPPSAASYAGEPAQEAAALRAWGGRGAVELLDFAADLGARLTCSALPGTPLDEDDDAPALEIVGGVLASLLQASIPRVELRSLAGAVDRFLIAKLAVSGDARELLELRIEEARLSAVRLAGSASKEMLLHGDLMDKNLLRDGDRFVAIDPMPASAIRTPISDSGQPHARPRRASTRVQNVLHGGSASSRRAQPVGLRSMRSDWHARAGGATARSFGRGCSRPPRGSS